MYIVQIFFLENCGLITPFTHSAPRKWVDFYDILQGDNILLKIWIMKMEKKNDRGLFVFKGLGPLCMSRPSQIPWLRCLLMLPLFWMSMLFAAIAPPTSAAAASEPLLHPGTLSPPSPTQLTDTISKSNTQHTALANWKVLMTKDKSSGMQMIWPVFGPKEKKKDLVCDVLVPRFLKIDELGIWDHAATTHRCFYSISDSGTSLWY